MTRIRTVLLALALLAGIATPIAASAPAQASCVAHISVTHTRYSTTAKLVAPCSGHSYRAWFRSDYGGIASIHFGGWKTATGSSSTAYYVNGDNVAGGWDVEKTGGGTISVHETY